jgi:hypothetical protein
MNWSATIAADLQRPMIDLPLPRPRTAHAAPYGILTPWGWKSCRPGRKTSHTRRAAHPVARIGSGKSDSSDFRKPWGW